MNNKDEMNKSEEIIWQEAMKRAKELQKTYNEKGLNPDINSLAINIFINAMGANERE